MQRYSCKPDFFCQLREALLLKHCSCQTNAKHTTQHNVIVFIPVLNAPVSLDHIEQTPTKNVSGYECQSHGSNCKLQKWLARQKSPI